MPTFSESLSLSLDKLYDQSSRYIISLELIQKLAQHLNFDTFIDENAYTHVIDKSSDSKFQRLSIAGSRILIDIDHINDTSVIKVGLSLATDMAGDNAIPVDSPQLGSYYTNTEDTISIDFTKPKAHSLVKAAFDSDGTDRILYNNLTNPSKRLNSFPQNLLYLQTLDRLSSSSVDLFAYMDNVGLFLETVNRFETQLNPEISTGKGYTNSIGALAINDLGQNNVGIFLTFWHDLHLLNEKLDTSTGKEYSLSLYVNESEETKDALKNSHSKDWVFTDAEGQTLKKKFVFEEDSQFGVPSESQSSDTKFSLFVKLNHSIVIPSHVIEFAGMMNYKLSQSDQSASQVLKVPFGEESVKFQIELPFVLKLVSVESLEIVDLTQLQKIVPLLRNFITYNNLIKSISQSHEVTVCKNSESELTEEHKHRLKESLKLPDNVTDEELLGLSAVTESMKYTGNQMIQETSIDNFMETDEEQVKISEFTLTVEDVDYASLFVDLKLSLIGYMNGLDVLYNFKISNGKVFMTDEVDMDSEIDYVRFTRALNVTEDIIKSIQIVFDKSG